MSQQLKVGIEEAFKSRKCVGVIHCWKNIGNRRTCPYCSMFIAFIMCPVCKNALKWIVIDDDPKEPCYWYCDICYYMRDDPNYLNQTRDMQTHCEWEKRNQALDKLKKSRADVIEKKRETALKKLENTKQKLRSKANRQLALEKLDDKSFLRAVQILETDAALQIEPAGLGEGAALQIEPAGLGEGAALQIEPAGLGEGAALQIEPAGLGEGAA